MNSDYFTSFLSLHFYPSSLYTDTAANATITVHNRTQVTKYCGSEHATQLNKEQCVNSVNGKVFACAKCSSVSRKPCALWSSASGLILTQCFCANLPWPLPTQRENAGGSNIWDIWNIRGRPNLEKEQPLNKPTSITSCPGRIFHDYCCCGAGHCSSGWKKLWW